MARADRTPCADAELVLPGSAAYERLRRPAIARFADARPAVIARCASPEHVTAALSYARRAGLRVAVRGGGHCFAGRSAGDRRLLLDLSPLDGITVEGSTGTVGGGARLGAVYDAFDRHGLTLPGGCGTTVGIGGLALGGGLGILGRRHGLLSDSLAGAQVVLADGRVVECDADREPALFWALRGAGGGRFGVVTALRFAAVPAPASTAFDLRFTPHDAVALLTAWQRWAPDAPDAVAASLLLTDTPDVKVLGAMAADEVAAREQLDQLCAAAGVVARAATFQPGSFRAVKAFLAGSGGPADDAGLLFSRSEFLARDLDDAAALVAHLFASPIPGGTRELDLTPWGGAYTRVPRTATAFAHRDARFLLKHSATVDPHAPPAATAAARHWLDRSWTMAHPSGTRGIYPNFPEPERPHWDPAYHLGNRDRLLALKRRYDPDDLLD
jgi:FAD/FMN-containing dehydrogenase